MSEVDELLMTERDGVWTPAPTPEMRRDLLTEASAMLDREMRRSLISNGLGLLLIMAIWPLAFFVAQTSLNDAAIFALFAAEIIPRVFTHPTRDLLDIRDKLARARGFAIPGRP